MAGYLISLNRIESLSESINKGVFSTILKIPENLIWREPHEGTAADYVSMKAEDNIYFFTERKIYGVGELVEINEDCTFLNYPGAAQPAEYSYEELRESLLLDIGEESPKCRFLCVFKPSPYFFQAGVDMDEVLSSAPSRFKILRVFSRLSLIKFTDEENQAFKDIIYRRNKNIINNPTEGIFETNYQEYHNEIRDKLEEGHRFEITPFIDYIAEPDGSLRHEMAVEASLLHQLSRVTTNAVEVFGKWDYLTHQVVASPFKPVQYMDKMDVFGYSYINEDISTISDYLIIEIKKGRVEAEHILQVMKYVDWVCAEYASGDYHMINAYLVGHSFSADIVDCLEEDRKRKFIRGLRPTVSTEWTNLKLIEYRYNDELEIIEYNDVTTDFETN